MRRILFSFAVVAATLVALGTGQGVSATTSTRTKYVGTTSQGEPLSFVVKQTPTGPEFEPGTIVVKGRCSATSDRFGAGIGVGGFRTPILNGVFDFTLNDFGDRLSWNGTVGQLHASGNFSWTMPEFDNEGGLQTCGTLTPITWTAAPSTSTAATTSTSVQVQISKNGTTGAVTVSVTH